MIYNHLKFIDNKSFSNQGYLSVIYSWVLYMGEYYTYT